jgi:hypothetical protein
MRDPVLRRAAVALVATALAAVTVGCATSTPSATPTPSAAPAPAPPVEAPSATPLPPIAAAAPVAESAPRGVAVPAIGLRTAGLVGLGLTPDGAMEVPDDAPTVGWFRLGPTPGKTGPAVLAAHVDYAGVDGAFVRLGEVQPGDTVDVQRADGTTATFTAYRTERFAKSAFPTEQVYGDTDGAELRLITCGGAFDDANGNYVDNVVVFARLTGVRSA